MKRYLFLLFLALWTGFFFGITPNDFLSVHPATGGDTGSHFYTLYVLVKNALPQWHIRSWNPGNLMGEPHLLHYFPGPFLVMALLSVFVPLGLAFNLGTLLPLYLMPLAVFFATSRLGLSWIARLLFPLATILFLFNESYSMWGGNAVSLLAGQFAHMYGLVLLFVFIGLFAREIQTGRHLYWSALAIAALAVCHSYILLFIPFFSLTLATFPVPESPMNLRTRWLYTVKLGILSFLLSAWFLLPQISHSGWMTGNSMKWVFQNPLKEILPAPVQVALILIFFLFPLVTYFVGKGKLPAKLFSHQLLFWLVPTAAGVGFFFVFPSLGLVDARAIPQVQLFCLIVAAFAIVCLLGLLSFRWQCVFVLALTGLTLWGTKKQAIFYPQWIRWNYAGWEAKKSFPDAKKVFEHLSGDFSQGRIANEHNSLLNDTGTTRVFEMTPYFARRATMESLYLESTFTSPLTHYLQALISKTPSCPVTGWDCPTQDFAGIEQKMSLLGVKDLVLVTEEAAKGASQNPQLKETFTAGPFHVFTLQSPVSLVSVFTSKVLPGIKDNFQRVFYDWFRGYNGSQRFISASTDPIISSDHVLAKSPDQCHPTVQVTYDKLTVDTDCPGLLHLLKFTYHPSFQANTGDKIYLTSPGFMSIIPSQKQVVLEFGQSWLWRLSSALSWLVFASLLLIKFLSFKKKSST